MTKLDEAKITSQGQVSIPKKIRERLKLHTGDKILFCEDEKGRIYIQETEIPVDFTPDLWAEFLAKTQKEPITQVHGKKAALQHLHKLAKK